MKGYGQFCPVAKALEVVGERWTPLIIRELLCGSRRFNELRRGVPLMSPSLLAQRLRTLERAGVIRREKTRSGNAWSYLLTPAGEELRPLVEGLGVWGSRWVRSRLGRDDLDPGLLMWDIRRRLDARRLPPRRLTIRFEFTDTARKFRHWWLVVDDEVDLCLTDPGFDVDLCVSGKLKDLTAVWSGDLRMAPALQTGLLQLSGPHRLRRALVSALQLGAFAGVAGAARTGTAG